MHYTYTRSLSTLLLLLGGRVADIEILLKEERFPEHWEPRVRSRFGLTMARFNLTVFRVELGTEDETKGASEGEGIKL